MKYRVRLDMSFDSEADARALLDIAESVAPAAENLKEGAPDEEVSFYDLEICRHDEGLPCTRLERVELRRKDEGIV